MATLHIDFETRSAVDLKKAGLAVYAADKSTDAWCMAYAVDAGPVELVPYERLRSFRDTLTAIDFNTTTFVAHNAAFELAIWNEIMAPRYAWPWLPIERTVCTMAMAYAMALPGSLEGAAAAVGIEAQKDMAGHRVMMQLSKPRDTAVDGTPIWWDPLDAPEKFQKLYAYCKQDVEVERQLQKRLMPLSRYERQVFELDYKINRRGVAVDVASAKRALELVASEKVRLDAEMRRLTGNAVATCGAHVQLADWLRAQGVKTEGVDKVAVIDMLELDTLPAHCRAVLLIRQEAAKTSTAKLDAMLAGATETNRLCGMFQYHAASTGRFGGRRVQLQNLPRPKLSQPDIDGVFGLLEAA